MRANIEKIGTQPSTWGVSLAGTSVRLALIRETPDHGFLLDRVGLTLRGISLGSYETLDALAGAIESALAHQRHEKSREQGVSPDTAGADQGPGARSSHIGASDPEVDSTLGIPPMLTS
jgi:hypothetical protein